MVGRYGGEEFIAYLSQVERGDALLVAEKLRHSVERINGVCVTISIGMCCGSFSMSDNVPETVLEYIRAADSCLYEAKGSGRNRVVVTSRNGC